MGSDWTAFFLKRAYALDKDLTTSPQRFASTAATLESVDQGIIKPTEERAGHTAGEQRVERSDQQANRPCGGVIEPIH